MSDVINVNIDLDAKCPECGKKGTVNGSLCLSCRTKGMGTAPMKSEQGRQYRKLFKLAVKAAGLK